MVTGKTIIFPLLLTAIFFGLSLLSSPKPFFAACSPDQYSQGDAYEPPFGSCGKSSAGDDCCATNGLASSGTPCPGTGKRCWPPFSAKTSPACPPGGTYQDLTLGGCDVCCLVEPIVGGPTGVVGCKWKPNKPIVMNAFDCSNVQQYALTTVPKNVCPADWTYSSTLKMCLKVSTGWSQNVITCRSASGSPTTGVQTAIGCIPTSDLVGTGGFILRWVFGAAGGLILLMLIITGYSLMTSGGNPEKLQAVKENFISILSGIILVAFSLVLLKAVGANILGLPGF